MMTPWGLSDSEERIIEGVTFYGTPSHGGFHLSPERERQLSVKLSEHGISVMDARMGYAAGWYEEDCCAYAVLFGFDEARPDSMTAEHCLERLRYWINWKPRAS